MGNLRAGHIVEACVWLSLVLFLYIYSFEFDKEIEIYKFGASAWPRTILLLVAIAAIGQLAQQRKYGDGGGSSMVGQASSDDSGDAAQVANHTGPAWYLHTFFLIVIPFVYMVIPDWIANVMALEKPGLHIVKLISGGLLAASYLYAIKGNHVGGIIALPILFGAFLQDFGFYAMAPLFIIGVMYLMGETRWKKMLMVMAGIYSLLLLLFLTLLYVGLPTGNISPFYEFGTSIVNILQ